jgi:RNA polymerase sigma-70 factor (ECF subfamily)
MVMALSMELAQPMVGNHCAEMSDGELIARIAACDEQALAAIYDRYQRLVYAIALRMTDDREVAEEVVQDVFQAVWQSAAGFQAGSSFVAWLTSVARHRAIDAVRSRRFRARMREETLTENGAPIHAQERQDQGDTVVQRLVIRAALANLPQAQRQAIELAYYGGLSCIEIAARTGAPVGTIKSRLRHGMLRLRETLAEARDR